MKKFAAKTASALLAALFLFGLATNTASAAAVSPSDMQGWEFEVQSPNGSGTLVVGPATPPLGTGSARLFTGTNGNLATAIHTTAFVGANLSNITKIEYSTYSQSGGATASLYPIVVMDVMVGSFGPDVLIFDPNDQASQTAQLNVWQTWANAQNGIWKSTAFPQFSGSIQDYVIGLSPAFGDIAIVNRVDGTGGLRLQAGPASTSDVFDENVDNFTIGINSSETTYDFEPDVVPIPTPTVATSAASSILSASATLNGSANPNGNATTGWFRYATVNPGTCDDSFGILTGTSSLGAVTSVVPYSQSITSLSFGTTYFYCAIASNAGGTGFGSVESFTTLPMPGPTTKEQCMNGGWQVFTNPAFKNQGGCIRFVN